MGWDKLPKLLGLLVLTRLQSILRQKNLYDTDVAPSTNLPPLDLYTSAELTARTPDGTYNDVSQPGMGMAGARFGRNIPLDKAWPETGERLMTPDPRAVSRRVLARKEFIPATSLNMLAATWIQFMVHDWFRHSHPDLSRAYKPRLESDDNWPEPELRIPAIEPDPTRDGDGKIPPTYINQLTAWWDGSAIYGDSREQQKNLRSGDRGKLKVSSDDPGMDPAQEGFWTGFAMMGTLFCDEHNSVCDALAAANPTWNDEELFQRARLVVCALMAKIHTVEWSPAILGHPTSVTGLRAMWYGIAGQKIRDTFGRIRSSEIVSKFVSGIPGGRVDHLGVPYSLTEEFGIVYRMHPLIPDDYEIRDWRNDEVKARYTLRELTGPAGKAVLDTTDPANLFYSFGTSHPGAIVLQNFPKFLQEFRQPGRHVHRPRGHRHPAHPRARRPAL